MDKDLILRGVKKKEKKKRISLKETKGYVQNHTPHISCLRQQILYKTLARIRGAASSQEPGNLMEDTVTAMASASKPSNTGASLLAAI